MTTARRREALVASLPDDADAMLVTKLVNVRYLTGFTGSNGAVLVRRDGEAVLATDGRYTEQAAAEAQDLEVLETRAVGAELVRRAAAGGVRRLAIERHNVTLTSYDDLTAVAWEQPDQNDCA